MSKKTTKGNVHDILGIGDPDGELVMANGILWLRWHEIGSTVLDIIADCETESEIRETVRLRAPTIASAAIRAKSMKWE